jgi:thiol-disulfide isomerase/thioredoxin
MKSNCHLATALIFIMGTSSFSMAQLRSAKALHTVLKSKSYEATLDSGFHFNEQAPNGIQDGSQLITPYVSSPQRLAFAPLPKDRKSAKVHLYVCDDAITFCEVHTLDLVKGSASKAVKIAKGNSAAAVQMNANGFILNNLTEAEARAQKSKAIIFADFGARWCPSCVRLEDEIFKTENFKKATAGLVKVKIDVDLFTNQALMEKYSVHEFPSILFLNSQGQEISRFTDYQPWEKMQPLIADVIKNPSSIQELENARIDKKITSEQSVLLAHRYFEAGRYSEAVELMDLLGDRPDEYLDAKVEKSIDLGKKDSIRRTKSEDEIKTILQSEGGSTRSLRWRAELIDLLGEDHKGDAKKLAEDADVLTDHILKNADTLKAALENDNPGEYTGYERFYVTFTNAEIAEAADVNPEKAWAKAYAEGKAANISPEQRGTSMRYLTTAILSHQPAEALRIVDGLIKKYPNEGDLKRRKLKILVDLKKYKEASEIGEEALKDSYGSNEFFVVEPLAQAYIGEQQKAKAHALLTKYLARNEMQFPNMEKSRKKFEALLKQSE